MLPLLLACSPEPTTEVPATPAPASASAPLPPPAAPAAFDLPSGARAITPSLTADGEDLLYVWQEHGDEKGYPWHVRFARRHAGAWTPPVELAKGGDILGNWADFPSVAVEPDGGLLAWWQRESGDASTFDLARSRDHGVTWAPLRAPFPGNLTGERGFVSAAAEPEGLRIAWLDGRGAPLGHHGHSVTALRTARLGADGFGPEEVVDPRTCDCCGTDSVFAGGHASIVYRDRDDAEHRDISVARSGASWEAGIATGADGWEIHGCPVNGPAADASGETVVSAWFTGAGDVQRVRAAFSTDSGATFAEAFTVADAATDARPLGRVDTLLEPDGTALVAWLSAEGDDGHVRIRRVAADGRVGPPLDLGATSTARSAGFPRLARHGGQIVAAWTTAAGNVAVRFDAAAVPSVEARLESAAPSTAATLPAFSATDLDGNAVSDTTLRGHPVLVNVWATWCGPCREELPVLVKLRDQHPGVKVLALSVDGPEAGPAVREMITKRAPGLTVLHPDTAGLAGQLGVSALPRTFLFDGTGTMVWSSTGALRAEDPELSRALEMVGG